MYNSLLFLNGLGTGEVVLILIVILVFFGSKRIPDLARGLGRGMREFKDAVGGVQDDIKQSIQETEKEINKNINNDKNQ